MSGQNTPTTAGSKIARCQSGMYVYKNPSSKTAKPISATEAAKLTVPAVLGGADGWNPARR